MNKFKNNICRFLLATLSIVMIIAVLPTELFNVKAYNGSLIETNLDEIAFVVDKATEFTVSSIANDDAGKMARGYFDFSNPNAIEKLEYYETASGYEGWIELEEVFGKESGFPIINGTSKFRVTFNATGEYNVDISLKDPYDSNIIYCATSANISVASNGSIITSDLTEKNITVFEPIEFTMNIKANNDLGKVVNGYFSVSDKDAIDKLEYYETDAEKGEWCTFDEKFGLENGFMLEDKTINFRVTFKKAGRYDLEVYLKQVSDEKIVGKLNSAIDVQRKEITGIEISPIITEYTGDEITLVSISGDIQTNDIIKYVVEGDSKEYNSVPKASAVGNYSIKVTVDRGANYYSYSKTVTSQIKLGEINLGNIKVIGLEGVYTGDSQEVVSVSGQGDYDLLFKLDDGDWSKNIPTVVDAGSYIVNVKATKTNYNDKDVPLDKAESAIYPFNVYVAKANQSGFTFMDNSPKELAYNEMFVGQVKGGQTNGKISYEVIDGSKYVTVDSSGTITAIKAGGVATIKATLDGNNNYNAAEALLEINTIKAEQSNFVFEKSEYIVNYGTEELIVKASGGQTDGTITYEIIGDVASISSVDNTGVIKFNSGKKGDFTINATLEGDDNYESISQSVKLTVLKNEFNDKVIVDECPSSGWYKEDVSIKPAEGFLISNYDQFDTEWKESITITSEGKNLIGDVFVKEIATGYISEAIAIQDIFIDKTNPTDLNITYSSSILDIILNAITFGFYDTKMKVTITAYDDTAGIDFFTYSYIVSEGGSKDDIGAKDVIIPNEKIVYSDNGRKAQASFKIPAQFRGYVSFMATDKSSNVSELFTDDKCIVVDDKTSEVRVSYDNNNSKNDKYYNAERNATISISGDNFFNDYLYTPIQTNNEEGTTDYKDENYLVITVGKRTNDADEYVYTDIEPMFLPDGDFYKAVYNFADEADYTFNIKYTDKSLNTYDSYKQDEFTIDKTKPIISVNYDNNDVRNGYYYKKSRTATIEIVERNFDAKDVVATVKTTNAQTTVFDYASYLSNNSNWVSNGDTHTATITFDSEANYEFEISYTDLAGNKADDVELAKFTIDTSAPTELDIKINDESVLGSMDTLAFNKFYKSMVNIKLSANCNISGVESFKYQLVTSESNYDENGTWLDYDSNGIEVKPNNKFILYFRAEDKAGNVCIVRSTGIVVDNKKPIGETNAPEIDIKLSDANLKGYYNGDVSVDVKVKDPAYIGENQYEKGYYSGLKKISYRIDNLDTKESEEGILFDCQSKKDGATFDTDKLVKSWKGDITIDSKKFNSNKVILKIIAIDNAGNERITKTSEGDIKIDITKPEINVSYDNNNIDSNSFFNANRVATINIVERNFDEKDVVLSITNKEGKVPNISKFNRIDGTGNGDDTQWVATINYVDDGDYQFDIKYTDFAGNQSDKVIYENGTKAGQKFTIDKTKPIIHVNYDNNDVRNGNYYKAIRTSTIVIDERNFDAERVIITSYNTTDNGSNPIISGWTTRGDIHTATIIYGSDGDYLFDIEMRDKAGNQAEDYNEESFIIDLTAPTLEIGGVENNSANNGDVIPVIIYSDTNFDEDNVSISLKGANRKIVKLDGEYIKLDNGGRFVFNNFPKEKNIDDVYELMVSLTDKAGNTTKEAIKFSVNRFGSTYLLDEAVEKINGKYIKNPIDIVVNEINTDELSNIKITVFKDGVAKILEEGKDYDIKISGGDTQWFKYTYKIFENNFSKDGVYTITIESNDKAGNISKNNLDNKGMELNFGVDSTEPNIIIENLESNTTYALDKIRVNIRVNDNLKLKKVFVELDGKVYKQWDEEELDNNGIFSLEILGDSNQAHNLVVYAVDAAGNGEVISKDKTPDNSKRIENFYVTTNLWVRYYTNEKLVFGSMAVLVVIGSSIVFSVVSKKKKNESDDAN